MSVFSQGLRAQAVFIHINIKELFTLFAKHQPASQNCARSLEN